jgi:predicted transcriptional regulator of viral defense system
MLLSQAEKMTASAKIERRVAAAPPGHAFTIEDFRGMASPTAVKTALSRLSKRGMVDRVRRGLYHKPRISRFGRGSMSADRIAFAAAHGKAPGPAGASAAAALGLTTQIPPRPTIAIVGNRPTSIPDVRFVERSNIKRVTAGLRPAEIALLEIVRDNLKWVEVPETAIRNRVSEFVSAGDIDVRRIRRAVKGETRRVAEKLEALLLA